MKPCLKNLNQLWIVELIVVGDIKHRDLTRNREALLDQAGVVGLHAVDVVGPVTEILGHFPAGAVGGSGRAGLDGGMAAKELFGGGAAPLIAAADKQQFDASWNRRWGPRSGLRR